MRSNARVSWLAFLVAALIVAPAAWTIGGALADYTAPPGQGTAPARLESQPDADEDTRSVQRGDLPEPSGGGAVSTGTATQDAEPGDSVGGATEASTPEPTPTTAEATPEPTRNDDETDPPPTPDDTGVFSAAGGGVEPLPDAEDLPQDLEGVRAWSGGDSMSYFVSRALLPELAARGAVQTQRHAVARVSSGLLSRDYYDWQRAIPHEMQKHDPDLVVFMIGANDAEPGMDFDAYRDAVAQTMDLFEGREVIWVGQPPMGPERDDIAPMIPRINSIFAQAASERPWVTYVDTFDLMSDASGDYMEVAPDGTRLRSADGVHLTEEGGERIAEAVLDAID
ncbi:MAG: GDSL-type esterase/lipase family protein [Dehalococcoidia bacterium]|nr:GDSL-type esterase/lipase family protein [Dehalococcoidia bacterium]